MKAQARCTAAFRRIFGAPPTHIIRSPGRVNLIGEHTDYNEGFVLPMAIDRAVWIALAARDERQVTVHALDVDQVAEFDPGCAEHRGPQWAEYVRGVAWSLTQSGYVPSGWRGVFTSDLPQGAGLSSSAALELAVARAFAVASDLPWDPPAMAALCQRAECEWVGVACGIMDQLTSACGAQGHALLIDCAELRIEQLPLPAQCAVVVLDTGTRRRLVQSAYNELREQCAAAARACGAPSLRRVDLPTLETQAPNLDERIYRRARHVITENRRTRAAADALRSGDGRALGRLMDASHRSLREDFAVSCPALDEMVACGRRHGACWGARLTGAGFGGCVVALVRAGSEQEFMLRVAADYRSATGLDPAAFVAQAAPGTSILEPPRD
jgi:galactokinase